VAALAALAAWPLVHRLLVARLDLDPWRFFGMAMYCVPKPRIGVAAYTVSNGRRENLVVREGSATHEAIQAFILHREAWGRRFAPDVLAAALARVLRVDELEILIREHRLDVASARIVQSDTAYRYDRAGRPIGSRSAGPPAASDATGGGRE
jgi:hypothetical protein